MILSSSSINLDHTKSFCADFESGLLNNYVLGVNQYSIDISEKFKIKGFIDDFNPGGLINNLPVISSNDLNTDGALVVVAVLGRPFTAAKNLVSKKIRFLDYFAFKKFCNKKLIPALGLDNFDTDFKSNKKKYLELFNLLEDEVSKEIFQKIVNFRLNYDLNFLVGFKDIQNHQYFEDFLELKDHGEVFLDIGCFDGFTSKQFIKRCPNYKKIIVFEPDPVNLSNSINNLNSFERISFQNLGLSNLEEESELKLGGPTSQVSKIGDVKIKLVKLDSVIDEMVTYIKMDIEGYELNALQGSRETIKKFHPILAISVYHKNDDFLTISKEVLNIRSDYKLYLRHYMEGISETVMYFVPKKD